MAEKKKEDTPKPAEVKAAERVVSNIPAKLKESFSSGTAARAVTKAWAAKAGKIATWTTVILMALVLVFDTIPHYMGNEPVQQGAVQSGVSQVPEVQKNTNDTSIKFGANETTLYASFEGKSRTVYIPPRSCVTFFPSEKFTVVRSTTTFIELQPLEPVVATFEKHPGGKPPCK